MDEITKKAELYRAPAPAPKESEPGDVGAATDFGGRPPRENNDRKICQDGGGLRYNDGKCRVELIPPEWSWALGMVLTRGAIKYADRNWERGMSWAYMMGSTTRHLLKFMIGERYDKESGNHHLAHAAWNCLGMMSYDVRGLHKFNDIAPSLPPLNPADSAIAQTVLDLTYTTMGPELIAKALEKQKAGKAA